MKIDRKSKRIFWLETSAISVFDLNFEDKNFKDKIFKVKQKTSKSSKLSGYR